MIQRRPPTIHPPIIQMILNLSSLLGWLVLGTDGVVIVVVSMLLFLSCLLVGVVVGSGVVVVVVVVAVADVVGTTEEYVSGQQMITQSHAEFTLSVIMVISSYVHDYSTFIVVTQSLITAFPAHLGIVIK